MTEANTTITATKNKSAILKEVGEIRKAYGTIAQRVQDCGLSILSHAKDYGDCDAAKSLVWAIPANLRMSLVSWFMTYSPIGVVLGKTEADTKVRFIRKESKMYHDFDIDAAKLDLWQNDSQGANPANVKSLLTAGDFFQNFENMLKRVIKDATEGKGKTGEPVYLEGDNIEVANDAEALLNVVRAFNTKRLAMKAGDQKGKIEIDLPKAVEVKEDAAEQMKREAQVA